MDKVEFINYYDKLLENHMNTLLSDLNNKIKESLQDLNKEIDDSFAYDEVKTLISVLHNKTKKNINFYGKSRDRAKYIDSVKKEYIYLVNKLLKINEIIELYNNNDKSKQYKIELLTNYIETYKTLGIFTNLPKNDIIKLSKHVLSTIKNRLGELDKFINNEIVVSNEYKAIIKTLSLEYKIILEDIYSKLSKFNYVKFNHEAANFYNVML